ncbi:hypothetical protein SteCoe_12207 [Stentor coeruleus]|uniref:TRP C-terminal domain-containing protein n=1 Tax=Stentor coeruleus TaxID=5963 RepID=A0A1R2CBE1_9CILI|nr:hypothetical protein SteCoe_12207 [Stentor coeruleus]
MLITFTIFAITIISCSSEFLYDQSDNSTETFTACTNNKAFNHTMRELKSKSINISSVITDYKDISYNWITFKDIESIEGTLEFNSSGISLCNLTFDGSITINQIEISSLENLSIKAQKKSNFRLVDVIFKDKFKLASNENVLISIENADFKNNSYNVTLEAKFLQSNSQLELFSSNEIKFSNTYKNETFSLYKIASSVPVYFDGENGDFTIYSILLNGCNYNEPIFELNNNSSAIINSSSFTDNIMNKSYFKMADSSLTINSSIIKSQEFNMSLIEAVNSKIIIIFSEVNVTFNNPPLDMKNSAFSIYNSSFSQCNNSDLFIEYDDSINNIEFLKTPIGDCIWKSEVDRVYLCENSNKDCGVEFPVTCPNGEININGCRKCSDTTFAVDYFNQKTCFECPSGLAECHNNTLKPYDKIWHETELEFSLIFRHCLEPTACKGSKLGKYKGIYNTECSNLYKGRFCHSCATNSTKVSLHKCSICPENYINALILIALIVMITLIAYYMIRTTVSSAFIPEEMYSMGIKIFVNYFQVIYLCLQYKLKWPDKVKSLTATNENDDGGSATANYFFSLKCLFNNNLDDDNKISEEDLFYYRVYFMMVLPILLYIGSWIYYGVLKLTTRYRYIELYRTVILIVPFLLVYPTVLTYSLSPLACQSLINGKPENFDEHVNKEDYPQYLIENRNIECNFEHYKRILFAVFFGIIIWGTAVPAYIFYQIHKKRKNLYEYEVKFEYGFLFNGYLHSRYYWEFIILSKKLIIVFLTVFMESEYDTSLQSVLVITFLIFFFILQIYFRPYFNEQLNNLEVLASLAAIITILCGIIYTASKTGSWVAYFLILVIFIVNFGFIVYWAYFMSKEMVTYLINNFEFLKRFRRHDEFDKDISREFKHLKFIYIKEFQKLFTQVEDDYKLNSNYLGNNNTLDDLYGKIMESSVEDYSNNVAPVIRVINRRQSHFLTK